MTDHPDDEWAIDGVTLPLRQGSYRIVIRGGIVHSIEAMTVAPTTSRWLAIPGMVNLHAHADRAFTAPESRPASLAGAIEISSSARALFTVADVTSRARRLLDRSILHGVTRIRTHTDVDPLVQLRSMEAICGLREAMSSQIQIDVIAFSTAKNDILAAGGAARLRGAMEMGADLIGAVLNFSEDPHRSIAALLDMAEAYDAPVDVHVDEHLAPCRMLIPQLMDAVLARDLRGRVTLSHACVLAALEADHAAPLIDRMARAEAAVVGLPETNLFLQDRGQGTPKRRGLTLVHELAAAGVKVRLGTDNVRDWFFPFGDGDMLDTAYLAAVSAQLDDHGALLAALCDGRADIQAGDIADIVLIPAGGFDDALARRPAGRVTIKAGRMVSGSLGAGP